MCETLISEFVEQYLTEAQTFYRSYSSLQSTLKIFSQHFGDSRVVDLRAHHITQYVHRRLSLGRKPSTVNQELAIIRSALNYARDNWCFPIEKNPVSRQRLKSVSLRLRYLLPSEAKALAEATPMPLRGFILLALHTGARKSELFTLRWADVDFERRLLSLRAENTKGNKPRGIPLNNTAIKTLHELAEYNHAGSEWVFSKRSGKQRKSFQWSFEKACLACGIENFHIHDLRHTFASWLVGEGVELIKVRDLLGHSTVKMTERYAHLQPSRLADAVDVLDRI